MWTPVHLFTALWYIVSSTSVLRLWKVISLPPSLSHILAILPLSPLLPLSPQLYTSIVFRYTSYGFLYRCDASFSVNTRSKRSKGASSQSHAGSQSRRGRKRSSSQASITGGATQSQPDVSILAASSHNLHHLPLLLYYSITLQLKGRKLL